MYQAEITITYARTIPTKPYGSDRIELTANVYLDEGEDADAITEQVRHQLRVQVDRAELELMSDLAAGQGSR